MLSDWHSEVGALHEYADDRELLSNNQGFSAVPCSVWREWQSRHCELFPGQASYLPSILKLAFNTVCIVFSALRAYVLSQSKFLGLLVFVLSMTQVGVNLVSAFITFPSRA